MRPCIPWLVAFALSPLSGLAAQGRVVIARISSRALGTEKAVTIYLPASYDSSDRRYPTAYYLHGGGGSERSWIDRLALDTLADSLSRAGLPDAILVMPDGDTGYWSDWARPDGFRTLCLTDSIRAAIHEAAESYCVPHGRYESYVVRDVVSYVDSAYRTAADPRHRGIAGFSMGGYGAFTLATRHPELFSAAVSHSGVVAPLYVGPYPYAGRARFASTVAEALGRWPAFRVPLFEIEFGTDTSQWWARDPLRQVATLRAAGREVPGLYFDAGSEDTLVIDQNRALHDGLTRRKVPHEFHEWPGGHITAYWRAHAAEGLAWLLRRIGR
jgi:S-formylglutathione hydrolase FrmB